MIQALFFDLDGTLINTLPLYLKSYDRALQEQGFHFTDKQIVDTCFGKTEGTTCSILGIPEKTEAFGKTYFAGVKSHYQDTKLFDGVLECLNRARQQHLKLGIISFAYNWYVDDIVKQLDLKKYFDIIIGHNDVVNPKPDPEAVILACEKLNVLPENSIMIGDSASDIAMGNTAGCKTVLFHPPEYDLYYDLNLLKSYNPNVIITDFGDFATLLPD